MCKQPSKMNKSKIFQGGGGGEAIVPFVPPGYAPGYKQYAVVGLYYRLAGLSVSILQN